jgi:FKBP-type peptidyl-prolyl cis-trans isomerase
MQNLKFALLGVVGCATMATFTACNNTPKDTATSTTDTTAKMTTAAPVATHHSNVADDSLFVKDPSGLDAKWVTHGTGTVSPKVGDIIEARLIFKMGDSTMLSTDVKNNNKPISQPLDAPAFKADVSYGLTKMKAGDSVVFRVKIDTLMAFTHQPLPTWMKSGEYVSWEIKLESVKTKAQMQAEMAEKNKGQNDIDDKKIQAYFASHKVKNAKKTASGIYYVINKQGTGAHPKEGQKVIVDYTGKNLKDEKFDSNVDPAFNHVGPFDFTLGQRVIEGWNQAVPLMNKGMKATFYIPSSLAYGAQAKDGKIGANEVLIFDIELVEFK